MTTNRERLEDAVKAGAPRRAGPGELCLLGGSRVSAEEFNRQVFETWAARVRELIVLVEAEDQLKKTAP